MKNARNLIEKKRKLQLLKNKKYIAESLTRKKLKVEFNNKLFIKSLFSNINNKNRNHFFIKQDDDDDVKKNVKLNTIQIHKRNNNNNILFFDEIPKLRKFQSYNDINEEKSSLMDINIKPNNKFIGNIFEEEFKNKDIIITPSKHYKKINQNKNKNKFSHNIRNNNLSSFLTIKRAESSINFFNKNNINENSTTNKNKKVNKSIQSSIDDILLEKYRNKNKKIKLKINKTNIHFQKIEYLKFLEKKSLALRANIIVNNIQEKRGGKQELRASYDPLSK